MNTKTYCKCFYLDSKIYPNDNRKGCCGICTNYDTVNSKCKIAAEVIEWANKKLGEYK